MANHKPNHMPSNESIQGTIKEIADAANRAIGEARAKVGSLAHDNRDKVAGLIDKAGVAFDDKTKGKYADKVVKAKTQALGLVDKVAEARPADDQGQRGGAGEGAGEGDARP